MRIQVNSVSPVVKEKSYFYFTLDYSQDGKPSKPKKIMSFAEAAYKALKDANEGDNFDVSLKKDDNGYWQWETVTQTTAGAPTPVGNTTGRAGDWETAAERALKQKLIVRQSCLAQAVAFVGRDGMTVEDANIDLLMTIAGDFEKWVNRE